MSIESDASSQVVGVYLKGIEIGAEVALRLGNVALKLSGKAMHNLLGLLVNAWRQTDKTGKHNITNFMRKAAEQGKTVTVFKTNVKTKEEYNSLLTELNRYGMNFVPVKGTYEVMVYQEDAPRLNHITEKLGLNTVNKGESEVSYEVPTAKYDKKMPDDVVEYTNADNLVNDVFQKELYKELGNDVKEYNNPDEIVNDIFDKNKTKNMPVKEQPVPIKAQTETEKKDGTGRSEPISAEEKKKAGNNGRISVKGEMTEKREERKNAISPGIPEKTPELDKAVEAGEKIK